MRRVRLTLHTDHTLIPNAMAFGVAHTNVKLSFAPLLPDALTDCGNGVYTAEFDARKPGFPPRLAGALSLHPRRTLRRRKTVCGRHDR